MTNQKFYKKKIFIITSIVILLLLMGGAYAYYFVNKDVTPDAYILEMNGDIEVLRDDLEMDVFSGMELEKNDVVKTGPNSILSLVIRDSSIFTLEENSIVELKSIVKDKISVFQQAGVVWTKATNLLGMDNFEIETPHAIALVRGTGFRTKVNNYTEVMTAEGKVEFKAENSIFVNPFEKYILKDGVFERLNLSEDDYKDILKFHNNVIKELRLMRMNEINSRPEIVNILRKKYEFTNEDIKKFFEDIDEGVKKEEDYIGYLPYKPTGIKKVESWNLEIRTHLKEIDRIKVEG